MKARRPLPLDEVLGDPLLDKRLDILRRIARVGSISEAARGAGISYKAAWQALETLANLAGVPLVEKAVGGSGGGGAALTPAGVQVLQAAEAVRRVRQQVLQELSRENPLGAAAALRTSMRNQVPGTVTRIRAAGSGVRGAILVSLALPGGALIEARITRESRELLGLAKGTSALALFKATAVEIERLPPAQPTCAPGMSSDSAASNHLVGTVVRMDRGMAGGAGGECAIELPGGIVLVGFAREHHGLRRGIQARANVAASSVVLALPPW